MSATQTACSLEELTRMEGMRRATLALTAKLSETQAQFAPSRGGWSVAQNMDHLVLICDMYRHQFEKVFALFDAGKRPTLHLSFDDIDVGFPYVPPAMMNMLAAPFTLINMFVPASVRQAMLRTAVIPARNPASTEPRHLPLSDIRIGLQRSVDALRLAFDRHASAPFDDMRIMHPLLGDNTVPNLLGACAAHEERHHKQISRVLADVKFPSA